MARSYRRSHIRARHAAARQAACADPRGGSRAASRFRPTAYAARPRRCVRRWFGHSSGRHAPAHARRRQSRCRAGRDRANRAAGPTACAARHETPHRVTISWPSFGLEARLALRLAAARVTMAVDEMIVDHAGRLHEGIDDRRADEFEAARGQLLGDLHGERRRGRYAHGGLEMIDLGPSVHEVPQEFREAGALLHDVEIGFRARYRAVDLGLVAHDPGIVHQRVNFLLVVACDLFRLEIVEGFAKIVALAQDRDPGQAGLETVEDQLLIERAVVIFRHAPFSVVIGDVERIFAGPGATHLSVGMQAGSTAHAMGCFVGMRTTSGSASLTARPPAVSACPASSASATRSMRTSAIPLPCADEPIVPTGLSPARTLTPGSGEESSSSTLTLRVRAVPRCCMRETTSWPT